MKREILLQELEKLASKLGLDVRYEKLDKLKGGVCRIEDKYYFIINKNLSVASQIELYISELKHFKMDKVFVLPQIRKLLEE
ncbi:hypothetical protein JXI42_10450 [bacterium]|nr:hypothetical protein [bacterium]